LCKPNPSQNQSKIQSKTKTQVVYLDAFRLTQGSVDLRNDHVTSCVQHLRNNPYLREAAIVYAVETCNDNLGGVLAHYLANVPRCVTMTELGAMGTDMRPGVPKTQKNTMSMMLKMKRVLATGALQIAEPLGTYRGVQSATIVNVLCDQMLAYRWDERTHKLSGKAEGGRDDLLISAMMILYWHEVFFQSRNPHYLGLIRTQNQLPLGAWRRT
jgi:hypothetical protein